MCAVFVNTDSTSEAGVIQTSESAYYSPLKEQ